MEGHICDPENRPIWKAMKRMYLESYPADDVENTFKCAGNYLRQYIGFAESPNPTDRQIDNLFDSTVRMAEKAKLNHDTSHPNEISSAKDSLNLIRRLNPDCDIPSGMRIYNKVKNCNLGFKYLPHAHDSPITISCSLASTQFANRLLPEHSSEIQQVTIKGCEKMGCSEKEMMDMEKAGSESCISYYEAYDILHAWIDNKLDEIIKEAWTANTRKEKVLLIEKFIDLSHHSGSIIDLACKVGEYSILNAPTKEVLDCLAGKSIG